MGRCVSWYPTKTQMGVLPRKVAAAQVSIETGPDRQDTESSEIEIGLFKGAIDEH